MRGAPGGIRHTAATVCEPQAPPQQPEGVRRQNIGCLRIYALSLFEVDRLESIVVEAS
jgi:hypothetical protein